MTTDRAEFKRLMLQIERDLVAKAHWSTLVETAGKTVARHRKELRSVQARMKRTARLNVKRAQR